GEDAAKTPAPELARSLQFLRTEARQFLALWQELDVLMTPTLALPPVPTGWAFEGSEDDPRTVVARQRLFVPFTQIFNVTGQPALSLPLHWSGDLPIGVQFVAGPFEEAARGRLGAQREGERPWADPRPA